MSAYVECDPFAPKDEFVCGCKKYSLYDPSDIILTGVEKGLYQIPTKISHENPDNTPKLGYEKYAGPIVDPLGHKMIVQEAIRSQGIEGNRTQNIDIYHPPINPVCVPERGGVYAGGLQFEATQVNTNIRLLRTPMNMNDLETVFPPGQHDRDMVKQPQLPPVHRMNDLEVNHPLRVIL
jgi:hypothetical protein